MTPRPFDEKQEAIFTATLVTYPELILELASHFKPEMLYSAKYRPVVEAIWQLWLARRTISLPTLADEMLAKNTYEQVGGLEFLETLPGLVANNSSVGKELAGAIKDHYIRRQEIDLAEFAIQQALDRGKDTPTRQSQLATRFRQVEKLTLNDEATLTGTASSSYYLDLIDQTDNVPPNPLRFPWATLRRRVPSLPRGTLVGLLADPGDGKTSWFDSLAEQWWAAGKRGVIYHLEDSHQTKLHRRTTRWTGIPKARLERATDEQLTSGNYLTDGEYQAIIRVNKLFASWPGELILTHCPGWTMPQILAHAERLHRANPLDYLIVDYLQKVTLTERGYGMNNAQLMAADIEDLKVFCETGGGSGQPGLVGLMAGQFDKNASGKQKRSLSDLSGTKTLHDKAQVGLIIDPEGEGLRVAKANEGSCGAVGLRFIRTRFLWTDDLAWNVDANGGIR